MSLFGLIGGCLQSVIMDSPTPASTFPAPAGTFPQDVENEANTNFQQVSIGHHCPRSSHVYLRRDLINATSLANQQRQDIRSEEEAGM